jgi:hypothetical protein
VDDPRLTPRKNPANPHNDDDDIGVYFSDEIKENMKFDHSIFGDKD